MQDSLITEGCKIYGNVKHSVLSAGVVEMCIRDRCRKAGQVLALKSSPAFASTRIVYCGVSVEACSSSFRPVSSP